MKKILVIATTLILSMALFAGCGGSAPELTEEDLIGKWQESDNLFDGESNFNLEAELENSPDWIEYYVFNEDGTASELLGENGETSEDLYTWEIVDGGTVVLTDDTFSDLTLELVFNENGNLVKDHSFYVEGMEIVYSKM